MTDLLHHISTDLPIWQHYLPFQHVNVNLLTRHHIMYLVIVICCSSKTLSFFYVLLLYVLQIQTQQ